MEIRIAKKSEISEIKKLIDSYEEMDTISETFPEKYYLRLLKKGILLVSVEKNKVIGVCFGTYNVNENWADLLGLVVNKNFRNIGIGNSLIKEFEKLVKANNIGTVDLYAEKNQERLFSNLGYTKGRTYISFRKIF